MTILIITILLVIIFSLIVIIQAINFMIKKGIMTELHPWSYNFPVPVIERIFDPIDIRASFNKIDGPYLPPDEIEHRDKWMLNDSASRIGREMLENGCIEVSEGDFNGQMPYEKRVELRARVYKERK